MLFNSKFVIIELNYFLDILINKYFFILLCFLFFIFVGLLIAANPYLAVKVYPDNQNIWQDCYAITYG